MQVTIKPRVVYKGNGQTSVFSFPFDYLRKSFIVVKIDGVLSTDYVIEQKTITFNTAPALNAEVEITRNTSSTRLVSWADASVLRAKDMNINDVQSLHLIEEQQLWAEQNSVVLDTSENWNMRQHRVINVLDPTEPQDAVTKHYMETVQGGFVLENTKLKDEATKQAQIATQKASEASVSAANAKTSEGNAKASEVASKASEGASKTSETNAKTSEINAAESARLAKLSEGNAKVSEEKAKASESSATASERVATAKAQEALNSANASASSASAAKLSETNAAESARQAALSAGALGDLSSITGIATQAEAEAGTDDSKVMTPLKVWQSMKKYIATFLMTAVFTGIIKGVTPPNDANDKTIPTTEWVQALLANKVMSLVVQDYLIEQNGYIRFRFGLILQWGIDLASKTDIFTFPIPFSNVNYAVFVTSQETSSTGYGWDYTHTKNPSSCKVLVSKTVPWDIFLIGF